MSTRFVKSSDNRTTASVTIIKNGSGGAPPVVESTAYPLSNVLNNDRYSVWASGAAPSGDIYVQMDLGADRSLIGVGYLGLRAAAGGAMPFTVVIGKRTAAEGYLTSTTAYGGGGGGTLLATLTSNVVDQFLVISSAPSRYVQFTMTEPGGGWLNGFSLGKFIMTTAITDLGIVYSPAAEEVLVTPQVRTRSHAGIPIATRIGLSFYRFLLPFRAITDTTLGNVQTVASVTDPFVYLRDVGGTFECLPSGQEVKRTHVWAPGNVWDTALDFEQLP